MKTAEQRRKSYRYGLTSEKLAGVYLRCKGYRILAERYRNVLGEIDIVARKGNTLVAVEVKARGSIEACEESITPLKRQRVARAMEGLLAGQKIAGLRLPAAPNIRFDVIWIAPRRWPRHIKDAWRL